MYATLKMQSCWIKSTSATHCSCSDCSCTAKSLELNCLSLNYKVCLCMVPAWVWVAGNRDWPQEEDGLEARHLDLSQTIMYHIGTGTSDNSSHSCPEHTPQTCCSNSTHIPTFLQTPPKMHGFVHSFTLRLKETSQSRWWLSFESFITLFYIFNCLVFNKESRFPLKQYWETWHFQML